MSQEKYFARDESVEYTGEVFTDVKMFIEKLAVIKIKKGQQAMNEYMAEYYEATP